MIHCEDGRKCNQGLRPLLSYALCLLCVLWYDGAQHVVNHASWQVLCGGVTRRLMLTMMILMINDEEYHKKSSKAVEAQTEHDWCYK